MTWRTGRTMAGAVAVLILGLGAVVALTGCGEKASASKTGSDVFQTRLMTILQAERARYVALGGEAEAIGMNDPLPAQFKERLREMAAEGRDAAAALEALTAPDGARAALDRLAAAIRERAAAFADIAGRDAVTMQQLEDEGAIEAAGMKIDAALEELRAKGYLPKEEGD